MNIQPIINNSMKNLFEVLIGDFHELCSWVADNPKCKCSTSFSIYGIEIFQCDKLEVKNFKI